MQQTIKIMFIDERGQWIDLTPHVMPIQRCVWGDAAFAFGAGVVSDIVEGVHPYSHKMFGIRRKKMRKMMRRYARA